MKRAILLLLTLTFLISSSYAIYSEINVDFSFVEELRARNYDIVFVHPRKGISIIATEDDLSELRSLGIRYEMIHDDVETFYSERLAESNRMGAYRTYDEIVTYLDSLHAIAPEIMSEKLSVGNGWLDNDMWMIKISDNVDIDEDEPEVLLEGAIHAREVITPELLLYYISWLVDGYGTDPIATFIVNHREVYIIPVVNPDGYSHNEIINPGGGGMWRKNYRDNGDDTYGVDLNRNFPYMWGIDDYGSSPMTYDATYRGPSAASEPETQDYMEFVLSRNFRTHMNWHSYSNLYLTPWGYSTDVVCDEHEQFMEMGAQLAKYNGYAFGNDVIYETNGGVTDWVYAEDGEKPMVWSFAGEVGGSGDGFWPEQERIMPLVLENLWANIYLSLAAKGAPMLETYSINDPDGDESGHADPGELISIIPTIRNRGTGPIDEVYVTISSIRGLTELVIDSLYIGSIDSFTSVLAERAFSVRIDPTLTFEDDAKVIICTRNAFGYFYNDTIQIPIGTPIPITSYPLEELTDETFDGDWQFGAPSSGPEESYTGRNAWCTILDGNYSDNRISSLEIPAVEIPEGFDAVRFSFWHWYSTEADASDNYDGGNVKISIDGAEYGLLFPLNGYDGELVDHSLMAGESVFAGNSMSWRKADFDISEFVGHTVSFRFDFAADPYVNSSGWYIDDISIDGYNTFSINVQDSKPEQKEMYLSTFPNPFNGSCLIETNEISTIEIFDINGKLIETAVVNTMIWQPQNNLESGIYLVKATSENLSSTKRVVFLK